VITPEAWALSSVDQTSVEALVYNRAAFGLAWLRVSNSLGRDGRTVFTPWRAALKSAQNLQASTKIAALIKPVSLWRARLSMHEGKFDEAVLCLNWVRPQHPFASPNFNRSRVELEISFLPTEPASQG